jgi:hypothetical protein
LGLAENELREKECAKRSLGIVGRAGEVKTWKMIYGKKKKGKKKRKSFDAT